MADKKPESRVNDARTPYAGEPPAYDLAWLQAEIEKGLASPVIERDARDVLADIIATNRSRRG